MEYFNVTDANGSEGSDISQEESVYNQEILIPQLGVRKNSAKNRAYQKAKSSFNYNKPKQLEVQERSINFGVRQTNVSNHPTIVEHQIKLVKDHRLRMSLPSVESCRKDVETIYYSSNKEGGDTIKGELADFLTYPVNLENIKIPRKRELHALMHHRICNNVNPDIVLLIDDHEFFCHKMVLQCYSKFFDDMNNLSGNDFVAIKQEKVTKQAFTAIYAWMISLNESGLKYITRENFVEVLMAAEDLEIKDLQEQCLALMDSTEVFSEGHAYQLFKQASRHGQNGIKQLMLPRIQHFFLPFVSTQDFLDLSLEDLCTFLSSNYIVVHSEMEVFMSAARWLLEDWNDRKQFLSKVMTCIRFGLMNPLELVDIRKNPETPEFLKITENATIQKYIDDGLAYSTYCTMKGSSDDLKYRCQLFGLEIPQPRNWTETPKHYKSYNEFTNYLKQIRANPLKIINDPTHPDTHSYPVNQEENALELDFNSPMHAFSDGIPSMSNLLSFGLKNREKKNKQKTILTNNMNTKLNRPINGQKDTSLQPLQIKKSRESLKSKAATIIQAAYRGYRVRKKIHLSDNLKDNRQALDGHSHGKANLLGPNIQGISHYKLLNKSTSDITLASIDKSPQLPGTMLLNNSPLILILGGLNPQKELGQNNDGRSIFRYPSEHKKWERVGYLPRGRYYLSSAYLKGKVYVLGGVDPKREEQRLSCICSDVWSFNPANQEWSKETNLRTPRKNFGVVSFQGHIFAIGGQGPNDAILSSVEKYDPVKRIWEEVCPLPEPRLSPAVAVFGGSIWVAGGMGISVKNAMAIQVYSYDIHQNRWITKPSLRTGKGFSVLVSQEDKLYLVGGAEKDKDRGCSVSSNTIDVYDPKINRWEVYSQMRIPRHSHTSAILDDCLYVIGGTTTQQMKSLNDVEICCLETRTWKHHSPQLPMVLTGHTSVLLPSGSHIMR